MMRDWKLTISNRDRAYVVMLILVPENSGYFHGEKSENEHSKDAIWDNLHTERASRAEMDQRIAESRVEI